MYDTPFTSCCGGAILSSFGYTSIYRKYEYDSQGQLSKTIITNFGRNPNIETPEQICVWLEKQVENSVKSYAFLIAALTDLQVPHLHDVFVKAGFTPVGTGQNKSYGEAGKDITVYLYINPRKGQKGILAPPAPYHPDILASIEEEKNASRAAKLSEGPSSKPKRKVVKRKTRAFGALKSIKSNRGRY